MKPCNICGQPTSYIGDVSHGTYEGKPLCPKCQMAIASRSDIKIDPHQKIQYTYKGKALPDNIKFPKIENHPKKDDLLVKRIISQSNG